MSPPRLLAPTRVRHALDAFAEHAGSEVTDLAVALVALDALVTVTGTDGTTRSLAVEDLHRPPGDRPDVETTLAPGDLLTGVTVPRGAWQASVYVKVRDRAAYAFALTSAAVALRLDDGGDGDGDRVADVRIVLGGLATKPWRCHDAEALLHGRPLTLDTATVAASACLTGARADDAREFTVELGRRTVVRALLEAGRRASDAR